MTAVENNVNNSVKVENELIDLNSRPQRMHGQTSNNQVSTQIGSTISVTLFSYWSPVIIKFNAGTSNGHAWW